VYEHWNNPADKQYSRNLGTGNGIELIKLTSPGPKATAKETSKVSAIALTGAPVAQ
jgi:hypothetical protein